MKLEGTLDAFSLPDIFQLLSFTKKTGTLHLRRDDKHGVVHLRDGAVTGGRGDAGCQALGRRLVGTGLVDDDTLADAVETVLDNPGSGLGKALVDTGKLDEEAAREAAAEQARDAVFELLRWPDGAFAFVVDEQDPDDLGARLDVETVVTEARARLEAWGVLAKKVPSSGAVVSLAPAPAGEVALSRDEWALLSLVDGSRTVAQLVTLTGTGEYAVVSTLAGLADRGLVVVGSASDGGVAQRQQLLGALEGRPAPAAPAEPEPVGQERKPVIPERPEPFTPERKPDFAEEPVPALQRLAAATQRQAAAPVPASASVSSPAPSSSSASVGAVQGAHALQPEVGTAQPAPAPSSLIDRDPSVNKSLLLRLIAGVRGL